MRRADTPKLFTAASWCCEQPGENEENMSKSSKHVLNLKAGEYVEVRSEQEILATLDAQGRLENLPFMPEMLQYCGKRLRVWKRADKTCDNIKAWSLRRMQNAVHLEGVRCDGSGHGGCEAGCLIFWKEAWLKRVDANLIPTASLQLTSAASAPTVNGCRCTISDVFRACRTVNCDGDEIYSCQATELRNFTSDMGRWDIREFIRDLRSGNLTTGLAVTKADRMLETVLGALQLLRALITEVFNKVQRTRHGGMYPPIDGQLQKTPIEVLNLQPGELVRVRSREEIVATLDSGNKNRGLLFEAEMLRWCGGIYRVLRRVYRIVDEKTGKMLEMKHPCIVLEGVACVGDY